MKPELLDGARRLALHDLGAALDAAGLEGDDLERVQTTVMQCFDAMLIAVEQEPLPRGTDSAVLRLVFVGIWPAVRSHLAPLLVSDPRTARRLRESLDALGRAGRVRA